MSSILDVTLLNTDILHLSFVRYPKVTDKLFIDISVVTLMVSDNMSSSRSL